MLRDTTLRAIASGGVTWQGAWSDGTAYVINDLVEHNGSSYIATQNHTASPATEPGVGAFWTTNWDLLASGGAPGAPGPAGADGADGESFVWRGQWSDSSSYIINEVVFNNGSSYIATADHDASFATEPGDGTSWIVVWDLMAQKGDTGDTGPQGPIGPQGPQGPAGADGVFDACDKLILEMEMEFKVAHLCYYKDLNYNVQKQLSRINIYSDSTANVLLFFKLFTYNAQKQLTQTDLTRVSDGVTLTTVFTYNAQKQLVATERSGYCSCP